MGAWLRRTIVVAAFGAALALQTPLSCRANDLVEAWPDEAGVDSRQLVALSAWIRSEKLDVRALLLVKDGRLVFERYGAGVTREHNHSVYSVTKSVTSTLVGILIDDGRIGGAQASIADVLSPVGSREVIRESLALRRSIEVRHVLSMSSGLRYLHDPEQNPIYRSPDRLGVALAPDFAAAPGARFNYSDGDATIAGALVVAASGMNLEAFARQRLFDPLGMRNVEWLWPDRQGLHPGGWALRLRAIDMAKFGQLILNGGRWDGQPVVSSEWIAAATTPKSGRPYGYFWWTDGLGYADFWARGYKGQRIGILPRHRAVVVLAAVLPRGEEARLIGHMMRSFVLPALEPAEPVSAGQDRRSALTAELALARDTPGDPRNTIEAQDRPRR
jgi:CubicO group peptidase (beta-lactamase class C family)